MGVNITPTLISFFLALPLFLLLAMGLRNYFKQRAFAREAAVRGWRAPAAGWGALLRTSFRLAGQTPGGAVWEMERFWHDGRLMVRWRAHTGSLPYGRIKVLADSAEKKSESELMLVSFKPTTPGWPAGLNLWSTHQQLAQRIDRPAVIDCLNRFPTHPQSGSLEKIVWNQTLLLIDCLYADGWPALERVVALGAELLT